MSNDEKWIDGIAKDNVFHRRLSDLRNTSINQDHIAALEELNKPRQQTMFSRPEPRKKTILSHDDVIRIAFYDDGSFSDSNGLGGTWSYNPSASRLYLQYAGGQFCNALFVGRFVFPPGQFQGVVLCRDGSGLWGTWSGSIATGTVLDLAGMPAMAPTGESTHE